MLNNESMEMYPETILRICKSNEKVRAVDIANQMRISKVSVCHAIKNLQAKDYVTYESRLIRLTKKGRILAEEIYERHCELTKLLISLGVDSAEKIRYIKRVNAVGRTPNAKEQRATMETQRLILRPFEQTDAQDVFEYLKDPQVHCFAWMKLKSLSEAEEKAREKAKDRCNTPSDKRISASALFRPRNTCPGTRPEKSKRLRPIRDKLRRCPKLYTLRRAYRDRDSSEPKLCP